MKKKKTIVVLPLILAVILSVAASCSIQNKKGDDETMTDTAGTAQTDNNITDDTGRGSGILGTSIRENGAKGDGKSDDHYAFIKGADGWLMIPKGKYLIKKDIVIKDNMSISPGAVIMPDDGVTVTVEGQIDAGKYKIFGEGGEFVINTENECCPEWFGAKADGKTDSTVAIQKAIDSFSDGCGTVVFSSGTYIISDSLRISEGQCFLTLRGTTGKIRESTPSIIIADRKKPALEIKGASAGGTFDGNLEGVTVSHLVFSRSVMGGENSDTILIENTLYTTLEHVGFSKSQNGVRAVNANGLRFNGCHGTTGGDIIGNEVRGIYIDGTERGSTGILVTDYIYYGYASEKSISYAYKDISKVGDTGDRRISNFECAGTVDYGIAIYSDASGWAEDISINAMTMDGVRKAGIWLSSAGARTWQQANISNVYLRLAFNGGEALTVKKFSNVNVAAFHVDNAVENGGNTAISKEDSPGGTISASSFGGADYESIISLTGCKDSAVIGCTSEYSGKIVLKSSENCIIASNAMPKAVLEVTGSSNCEIGLNRFSQ